MNPETNLHDDFGPILDGISIPDTVVLPPEVVMLLPWMSLAELKVVIAAVARLMQVGGAEPITLSEFEIMTGLDRKSVLDGIERAVKRGLLISYSIGRDAQEQEIVVFDVYPRFQKQQGGQE
ncbi:MAG: hypothetical protein ACPLRM_04735 [Anaerolineae bacterium]|uniref:Uncharacterized protein n=1 Tax=Thermanaerothrix solaris TaxID=3058434 RepID=A0ABU3NRQ0_9CHLR|nr:hypothetical protein [Thermanaerothrix sp. 4228-RoL]MDT8899484.1 hypothetical protein [Thermanaerothrix sp. 4228-RoL]